jgi:hypothetical protein
MKLDIEIGSPCSTGLAGFPVELVDLADTPSEISAGGAMSSIMLEVNP